MNLRLIDNQLLRARLYVIKQLIPLYPESKKILQNGHVPPECREDFEILENEAFRIMHKNKVDNSKPLTFVELCSFCTWFEIYPEKIAGKEVLKTSRAFPVSIEGTKVDIINTIEKGMEKNRIRIVKARAEAKLKLLKLMKL